MRVHQDALTFLARYGWTIWTTQSSRVHQSSSSDGSLFKWNLDQMGEERT